MHRPSLQPRNGSMSCRNRYAALPFTWQWEQNAPARHIFPAAKPLRSHRTLAVLSPENTCAYSVISHPQTGWNPEICFRRFKTTCRSPLPCPCAEIWDSPATEAESYRDRHRYFHAPCNRSRHDHGVLPHSRSDVPLHNRSDVPLHNRSDALLHSRSDALLHARSTPAVCRLSRRNHLFEDPYHCSIPCPASLSSSRNRAVPSRSNGRNYSRSRFPSRSNSEAIIKENSSYNSPHDCFTLSYAEPFIKCKAAFRPSTRHADVNRHASGRNHSDKL